MLLHTFAALSLGVSLKEYRMHVSSMSHTQSLNIGVSISSYFEAEVFIASEYCFLLLLGPIVRSMGTSTLQLCVNLAQNDCLWLQNLQFQCLFWSRSLCVCLCRQGNGCAWASWWDSAWMWPIKGRDIKDVRCTGWDQVTCEGEV